MTRQRLRSVIKEKRLEKGLTQAELASMAGVTKNYVTMVERGTRKGTSLLVRVALAEALGIPILEVITREEVSMLKTVESAVTLEQAEVYVWGLRRCMKSKERPPGSKTGALLAIRKLIQARPDQREELEGIRGRLNELFS